MAMPARVVPIPLLIHGFALKPDLVARQALHQAGQPELPVLVQRMELAGLAVLVDQGPVLAAMLQLLLGPLAAAEAED